MMLKRAGLLLLYVVVGFLVVRMLIGIYLRGAG